MRILLDTNVLVRAAITPTGLARKLLRFIERNEDHVLIVSAHLLSEVAEVLRRPRIRERWPVSDEEIEAYCQALGRVGETVSQVPLSPVIRDAKDQAVIEAAIAGRADIICTLDAHFSTPPASEFLERRRISVLGDVALLALFDKQE